MMRPADWQADFEASQRAILTAQRNRFQHLYSVIEGQLNPERRAIITRWVTALKPH